MLDDLKVVHERDPKDMLGVAEKQIEQLLHNPNIQGGTLRQERVAHVVCSAMGGSALGPMIAQVWPSINVPLLLLRDYDIPTYVNGATLFIAISYSGNTEETLTALDAAQAKGAQIVVITSGGKLRKIAEEQKYPLVLLPDLNFPRYGAFQGMVALLHVLKAKGIMEQDFHIELEQIARFLREAVASLQAIVPTSNNRAKQIAYELIGKSIVVYSGPKMHTAAYKWKIDFNENAKQLAWINQYPELDHNELTGWTKQPVNKPYAVIELRSGLEHIRNQNRAEISDRLLSGMRPAPIVVDAVGSSIIEQLLYNIVLGDFVSLYLAFLSGANPVSLDVVDKLKEALNSGYQSEGR